MRGAFVLALGLVLGLGLAGEVRAVAFGDPVGDVREADGSIVDLPSADIILVTSTENGSRIDERVTVAAHPSAPEDLVLARTWFHRNASDDVLDLQVDGGAINVDARFTAVLRQGQNATALPNVTYGLDNDTWVFSFDASALPNATCFQLAAFTRHTPHRGNAGADAAFSDADRECLGAQDPPDPLPVPRHVGIVLSPPVATIPPAPPGSSTPRLIPAPIALIPLALAAACLRRRK